MITTVTPSVAEAVELGYADLAESGDLYDSPAWHALDEAIGIAEPFTVLVLPDEGSTRAVAGTWGMVVDDQSFWPFMRIDTVLSAFLARRGEAPRPSPGGAAGAEGLSALMPSAYLGALRAGTTRLLTRPDVTGEQSEAALRSLLDGAEAMARARGLASVACLYLPVTDGPQREVLLARGYAGFGPALHVSILAVRPFDAYLASLSQHRRSNVRRHRRLVAAAGVTISREPLTAALSEEMLPLEAQLYQKYEHVTHPTQMARIVHGGIIAAYGEHAQVIAARSADGVLRGYSAFIHLGDTLYSRDCGFDYSWLGNLPLYLETNYYRAIEFAAEAGATRIHYSYGSDETKAAYGCQLHPRMTYVKAFDPALAAGLAELAERVRDRARPAP
ncbi:MAG TPA: peptidogalycan biosysnthesis protein [Streptosporangiaceae bacterium]|nr:peptidogalycan biosysnthesis protein [Streptosporangiaceae bacterium]